MVAKPHAFPEKAKNPIFWLILFHINISVNQSKIITQVICFVVERKDNFDINKPFEIELNSIMNETISSYQIIPLNERISRCKNVFWLPHTDNWNEKLCTILNSLTTLWKGYFWKLHYRFNSIIMFIAFIAVCVFINLQTLFPFSWQEKSTIPIWKQH